MNWKYLPQKLPLTFLLGAATALTTNHIYQPYTPIINYVVDWAIFTAILSPKSICLLVCAGLGMTFAIGTCSRSKIWSIRKGFSEIRRLTRPKLEVLAGFGIGCVLIGAGTNDIAAIKLAFLCFGFIGVYLYLLKIFEIMVDGYLSKRKTPF